MIYKGSSDGTRPRSRQSLTGYNHAPHANSTTPLRLPRRVSISVRDVHIDPIRYESRSLVCSWIYTGGMNLAADESRMRKYSLALVRFRETRHWGHPCNRDTKRSRDNYPPRLPRPRTIRIMEKTTSPPACQRPM